MQVENLMTLIEGHMQTSKDSEPRNWVSNKNKGLHALHMKPDIRTFRVAISFCFTGLQHVGSVVPSLSMAITEDATYHCTRSKNYPKHEYVEKAV